MPWAAVLAFIVLLLGGMVDNVLKPLLLGRGVDAPMPVILLGALGGMATTRQPAEIGRIGDPVGSYNYTSVPIPKACYN